MRRAAGTGLLSSGLCQGLRNGSQSPISCLQRCLTDLMTHNPSLVRTKDFYTSTSANTRHLLLGYSVVLNIHDLLLYCQFNLKHFNAYLSDKNQFLYNFIPSIYQIIVHPCIGLLLIIKKNHVINGSVLNVL